MPEGNVFLDNAGGGKGDVVGTLAEEGSLLAGSFRERQAHRTIVTAAAHKGLGDARWACWNKKVHSLSAGGGAHCAQKLSD